MRRAVRNRTGPAVRVKRWLSSLLVWALLWWLLTEGRGDAWWIGVPAVLAATYLSQTLAAAEPLQWNLLGWLRFLPMFIRSMLLGAIDVAWRSLHPRLPVAPQMIQYKLRLPTGTGRVFFMTVVNLLPGTLSADLRQDDLTVHVFDARHPIERQLNELERAVARMFVISLAADRNWKEPA